MIWLAAALVLAWFLAGRRILRAMDDVSDEEFMTSHGRKLTPPRSPVRRKRGL